MAHKHSRDCVVEKHGYTLPIKGLPMFVVTIASWREGIKRTEVLQTVVAVNTRTMERSTIVRYPLPAMSRLPVSQ